MKISKLVMVLTLLLFVVHLKGQEVKLIGIHLGNPENFKALDQSEFPNFEFYTNDAKLIRYSEEQKLIGLPANLVGWYGEVPEKFGFCANYTIEKGKGYSGSYQQGVLYVVDQAGTVAYQIQPDKINHNEVDMVYPGIQSSIASLVKKCKKGKLAKPLKAAKQSYIKSSGVAELEASKGSKIDKSGAGITGWTLPDLSLKNADGESLSLKDLTKDQIAVVVFFTLNGTHYVKGDADGNIVKEWDGQQLISPSAYAGKVEDKVMNADVSTKAEAKKQFAKTMMKEAVASSNASLLKLVVLDGDEIDDRNKVDYYKNNTQHLTMVEEIADKLKK